MFIFLFFYSVTDISAAPRQGILGRDEEALDMGLGELAGLTITNEAEMLSYDVSYY